MSKRFAVNDRLIAVNGARIVGIDHAVELLKKAADAGDETVIEMIYGFAPPENHEFEAESGLFVPKREEAKSGGFGQAVRRSLSFGKKKKGGSGGRPPETFRWPAPSDAGGSGPAARPAAPSRPSRRVSPRALTFMCRA